MDPLKIAIIGYGHIARVHLEQLLKFSQIEVKALYSRSIKKTDFPSKIVFYTDYKEMLAKEEINTVLICTPTHTHEEIVSYCSQIGMNMFLEKPMARTLEECHRIIENVRNFGKKLFLAHVLRFWPTYGSIKDFLNRTRNIMDGMNKFMAERLATFPWSRWFADETKSGGVILDLSIHDIDYALWLFGKPISVKCDAKNIMRYEMEVLGESTVEIEFSKDKWAECKASWTNPEDFQFFTNAKLIGSQDSLEFNGDEIFNNNKWKIENIFQSDNGYFNQMDHFLTCLSERRDFSISVKEGLISVKTCLAAIKSAKKGGKQVFLDELD